jgi:hypothetical protein
MVFSQFLLIMKGLSASIFLRVYDLSSLLCASVLFYFERMIVRW